MIQLTTISGINIPSEFEIDGKNAFKSISITVTNAAITTMYDAILTFDGINFLKSEIAIFEPIKTNVDAMPIPSAFLTDVVVASVGHIPIS